MLKIAFILILSCAFILEVSVTQFEITAAASDTGCDLLPAYNILSCYSTKNDSVAALQDALQQTAGWPEVHLMLNNYAVDQLPSNIFSDVSLTYLSLNVNCTSNGIPKSQLQSITSQLSYLELVKVSGIKAISQSDFANLLFSHDLKHVNLQLNELTSIEDGSFIDFDSLVSLSIVQASSLNQLNVGLLQGLSNLQELTVTYSAISTLPQDMFISTPALKNLWLGQNNLQTLANGTMNGLEQLQIISLAGNPFHCDCSLQWFKDWLINKDLLSSSGATCAYPTDAPFQDVDFCPGN